MGEAWALRWQGHQFKALFAAVASCLMAQRQSSGARLQSLSSPSASAILATWICFALCIVPGVVDYMA